MYLALQFTKKFVWNFWVDKVINFWFPSCSSVESSPGHHTRFLWGDLNALIYVMIIFKNKKCLRLMRWDVHIVIPKKGVKPVSEAGRPNWQVWRTIPEQDTVSSNLRPVTLRMCLYAWFILHLLCVMNDINMCARMKYCMTYNWLKSCKSLEMKLKVKSTRSRLNDNKTNKYRLWAKK